MIRSRRFRRRCFLAVAVLLLTGSVAQVLFAAEASHPGYPKNIVILLADGVAGTPFEIARYASRQLRNQPFTITDTIFTDGTVGLLTTHAHDATVTDSAAAGSAMSTGVKTTNGTIAMTPDGRAVRTAMETAKAMGKRIGLVTTATVYDATPAAFSVHARSRRDYQTVVDQYLALEPDVILGGGSTYFLPGGIAGGKRTDGKDAIAAFKAKGYQVARNVQQLHAAVGPRLLGLFAEEDMRHELDRDTKIEPSIAEMAGAAIRVLSKDCPNGFLLLLETENTDTAGHRNDIAALITDLWVFDRAAQLALEFQRRAPSETLIIVTGDHETGGLRLRYALQEVSRKSSRNPFYTSPVQIEVSRRITRSIEKGAKAIGLTLSPEALDKLGAQRFPGFRFDRDPQQALSEQPALDRNLRYPAQGALTRRLFPQVGVSWETSGHTAQPVIVGVLGPKAEMFKGSRDNTDFGEILHRLIEGPQSSDE